MRHGRVGLGIALSLSVWALASTAAQAGPLAVGAYAYAENILYNFTVAAQVPNAIQAARGLNHVDDQAFYNAAPAVGFQANGALPGGVDVLQATNGPGPFPGQNDFGKTPGRLIGMVGARADAAILAGSPFVSGGAPAAGVTVEGELPGGTVNFAASVASAATTIQFRIGTATALGVQFRDDVALEAATANAPGAAATAQVATDVVIYDSLGNKVFEFTPNGTGPRAILGGQAVSDPFNLQTLVTSNSGVPGDAKAGNISGRNYYAAISAVLPAGLYTLGYGSQARENVASVPEPATLGLLGAGLAGLAWVRRRR